jgi:Sperm-tail PG-rich repeat
MGYGPNNYSIKSEKRFDDTLERRAAAIPGPGQYDPKTDVNSYFLDRFKNSGAPVFTK